MPDEEKPAPPEKITVALPAMTDRALLEDLYRSSRITSQTVDRLEGSVSGLVVDGRDLHGRMTRFEGGLIRVEGRIDRLENPSIVPPSPMTSTGVKALINTHPSQMDMEQEAKLSLALAALAEERAKREALEKVAVTKKDVTDVVSAATSAQTVALVTKLTENKKLGVIAGLVAAILIGWLGRIVTAPPAPPATPPAAITVPQ